jgi:hypothetical protein
VSEDNTQGSRESRKNFGFKKKLFFFFFFFSGSIAVGGHDNKLVWRSSWQLMCENGSSRKRRKNLIIIRNLILQENVTHIIDTVLFHFIIVYDSFFA